jgi:hypothetical protein
MAARDFGYQNAQRGTMRTFDGVHETLAIVIGAKNHVVEVIESHRFPRCAGAPLERELKQKIGFTGGMGSALPSYGAKHGYSLFQASHGPKIKSSEQQGSLERSRSLDQARGRPLDTLFGRPVRGQERKRWRISK